MLAIFAYYAGIMLNAFTTLLCSKLCWHNRLKPIYHSTFKEQLWTSISLDNTENLIIGNIYCSPSSEQMNYVNLLTV